MAGSRGSVIPFFKNIISNGGEELPITDYWMTRFWISLEDGVKLVIHALENVRGGKTFIAKIPSIKITDLVEAILPGCRKPEVGICEGEIILWLCGFAPRVIYLNYNWWKKELIPGRKPVEAGFEYSSEKTKNGLP